MQNAIFFKFLAQNFWICQTAERRYLRIFSISNYLNYNYVDAVDNLHCISPEKCKMQQFSGFWPKIQLFWNIFQKSKRSYLMIIVISNILNHNYIEAVDSVRCISQNKFKMLCFSSFWPKIWLFWIFSKIQKKVPQDNFHI